MSNLKKKLPKWAAPLLGDYNYDSEGRERGEGRGEGEGRGGSKSSLIELLTRNSESKREQPKSSVWKPVWYTGWHTGVLACATSVVVVLLINVGLTVYATVNPEYKMERGIGTLYSGSCDKSRTIGLWLHLLINVLSTLLLSGSNYTQQCLTAPTRSEIDASHERKRWMDIGVPSIRNLFRIKLERTLLWMAIGITSIPLHLLYNSAVFTSLAANEVLIAFVASNHFESGGYSNTTGKAGVFEMVSRNDTTGKEYGDPGYQTDSHDIQLFISMLEGYSTGAGTYDDLTPSQCTNLYNTDFVSSHRNLFLITKHTPSATYNNTFFGVTSNIWATPPNDWICSHYVHTSSRCDANWVNSRVADGLPWLVMPMIADVPELEVRECKSERVAERCKVQFSLGIMIAVICCNLVKACCMVLAVLRSREPTLVTLGDAVDSFLRIPDPATVGICFADRRFIEREWRNGCKARPRQWKQKGVRRWWSSASKKRWITCNFFCSIAVISAGVLLGYGIGVERRYMSADIKSLWTRGFGKVNSVSLVPIHFRNTTQAILLANLPQTILSFLYLTYNSLFTCMLSGHEWSLFSHHHRTLRVTSPRPGQRSTYWLQMPYTYAIPLMILSGLLHWLTSQSIFLAKVDIFDPFGGKTSRTISTVGYSCIATIFALGVGILALLIAGGIGYKPFAAEITIVGSCSAAISAACHAWGADTEEIVGKKVRWGDVENVPNLRVRHLTFSSGDGVKKPVFGEVYAGSQEREEDCS